MRVVRPAHAPRAWPRVLLVLSGVDWVRETERGASHLSAFLEEGDVVVRPRSELLCRSHATAPAQRAARRRRRTR